MLPDDDLRIDPDDLRHQQFPAAFRGYETNAVDAAMHRLAGQVERLNRWIASVQEENYRLRMSADLEAAPVERSEPEPAAAPAPAPAPIDAGSLAALDEAELVALIGEETARVLGTARTASDEIKRKAEESAARTIKSATDEAHALRVSTEKEVAALRETATAEIAEQRTRADAEVAALTAEARSARDTAVADATEAADAIRLDATEAADALRTATDEEVVSILADAESTRDQARTDADETIAAAKAECGSMLDETKSVRARMLEDLAERRRAAKEQLEQLVAGRDELLGIYAAVRADIDRITGVLSGDRPTADLHLLDDPPELAEALAVLEADAGPIEVTESVEIVEEVVVEVADEPAEAPAPDAAADEVEPAGEVDDGAEAVVDEADGPDAAADEADEADGVDATDESGDVVDLRPVSDDGGGVDALFARIRQDRATAVDAANEVLDADEADADEAAPDARAEQIATASTALAKAIKRVLSDEQNDVLDTLRRVGSTDLDELLPALDDHVLSYAAVAHGPLRQVVAAAGAEDVEVGGIAEALAWRFVEPLRDATEAAAADADDADDLDASLRTVYRDHRTHHLAGAVEEAVTAACRAAEAVATA